MARRAGLWGVQNNCLLLCFRREDAAGAGLRLLKSGLGLTSSAVAWSARHRRGREDLILFYFLSRAFSGDSSGLTSLSLKWRMHDVGSK